MTRSRRQQRWYRLAAGDLRNVSFVEFRRLIESFGFGLRRVSGSHYTYTHPKVPRPLACSLQTGKPSLIKFRNSSTWFGNSA